MTAPVGPIRGVCLLVLMALGAGSWPDRARAQGPSAGAKAAADLIRSSDDYGKIDWKALPPWEQTSFFGVRARGQLFVYVVDCSGSMGDGLRLSRAKAELRRSITGLRFPQRFLVIFYNDAALPMPGGVPKSADGRSKDGLARWLGLIDADGATDPRSAMDLALGLRPDAVFLLSDGEFPDGTAASIARRNRAHVPIHCIDLAGGAAGDQLKRIARDSKGQYAARP